jgi:hypothetical protein
LLVHGRLVATRLGTYRVVCYYRPLAAAVLRCPQPEIPRPRRPRPIPVAARRPPNWATPHPCRGDHRARAFGPLPASHSWIRGVGAFAAPWSSQVARWAHNPEVVGSNPTGAIAVVVQLAAATQERLSRSRRKARGQTAPGGQETLRDQGGSRSRQQRSPGGSRRNRWRPESQDCAVNFIQPAEGRPCVDQWRPPSRGCVPRLWGNAPRQPLQGLRRHNRRAASRALQALAAHTYPPRPGA